MPSNTITLIEAPIEHLDDLINHLHRLEPDRRRRITTGLAHRFVEGPEWQ